MAQPPRVIDLGPTPYAAAYRTQLAHHTEVLNARDAGRPETGRILLVEHDPPVITISRRPGAREHLLATPETLERLGVQIEETDRGGDITYHGPGQLVVYPILDLQHLHLRLQDYMRLLEAAVMDTCAAFGVAAQRDACATGVWVPRRGSAKPGSTDGRASGENSCDVDPAGAAKVCAMGVRIRRWISLHGLALNVTTDLSHFGLIVPCGLVGRPVTSLSRELGQACPTMDEVKTTLAGRLTERLVGHAADAPERPAPAFDAG